MPPRITHGTRSRSLNRSNGSSRTTTPRKKHSNRLAQRPNTDRRRRRAGAERTIVPRTDGSDRSDDDDDEWGSVDSHGSSSDFVLDSEDYDSGDTDASGIDGPDDEAEGGNEHSPHPRRSTRRGSKQRSLVRPSVSTDRRGPNSPNPVRDQERNSAITIADSPLAAAMARDTAHGEGNRGASSRGGSSGDRIRQRRSLRLQSSAQRKVYTETIDDDDDTSDDDLYVSYHPPARPRQPSKETMVMDDDDDGDDDDGDNNFNDNGDHTTTSTRPGKRRSSRVADGCSSDTMSMTSHDGVPLVKRNHSQLSTHGNHVEESKSTATTRHKHNDTNSNNNSTTTTSNNDDVNSIADTSHAHEPGIGSQPFEPSREEEKLFVLAQQRMEEASSTQAAQGKSHSASVCKRSRLKHIVLGTLRIPVWHNSAYPKEYQQQDTIYVCQYCLQYFKTQDKLSRHMEQPQSVHSPHPPGDEIYRKGNLALWEINGSVSKVYSQNLCLLSKLFLDSKTLWLDVGPFLFYVLTEWDEYGATLVGYFSKEKSSFLNYNLSCIMTLPQYQRQGYGQAMIELSYLLTRKEQKAGTPEKPLSDLGLLSYRSYWKRVILRYLRENPDHKTFSIQALSDTTGITPDDIVSTLQSLHMVKYWRGKYVIVDSKVTPERTKQKGKRIQIDPSCLRWSPLVLKPEDDDR